MGHNTGREIHDVRKTNVEAESTCIIIKGRILVLGRICCGTISLCH